MSNAETNKQARLLRGIASHLRAGRDELVELCEGITGEERDRILNYVENLEGCLQRVSALADKVILFDDPGTPEENADLAKLRRQINRMLEDLLDAARDRAALEEEFGEGWETVN
jgi:hypothetical protein